MTVVTVLLAALSAVAQKSGPVSWNIAVADNCHDNATLTFSACIEKGWHLYALELPEDGPNATTVTFDIPEGVCLNGGLTASKPPLEKFDNIFSLNLPRWENDVMLTQHVSIMSGGVRELRGEIRYQACNGQTCVPPQKIPFSVTIGTADIAAIQETDSTATDQSATKKSPAKQSLSTEDSETDAENLSDGDTYDYKLVFYSALAGGIAGGLIASAFAALWFSGYLRRMMKKLLNHQLKAKSKEDE